MSQPDSRLYPWQVCFVVDDVETAIAECGRRFGWGPFERFTAEIEDVEYRGRVARRVTNVALGQAGRVQVELVHVREGFDCIATYQQRYARGFQHLGIGCRSRDAALERLESLGARLDDLNEYGGIKIAFVDVPTGPGMFELLQPTREDAGPAGETMPHDEHIPVVEIDRATIVTDDMDAALEFHAQAFDWRDIRAEQQTLRYEGGEVRLARAIGRAGLLEIELVEGRTGGSDPYSAHLARGDHGLVHAGALTSAEPAGSGGCWLETGEHFWLEDWPGGASGLQLRSS